MKSAKKAFIKNFIVSEAIKRVLDLYSIDQLIERVTIKIKVKESVVDNSVYYPIQVNNFSSYLIENGINSGMNFFKQAYSKDYSLNVLTIVLKKTTNTDKLGEVLLIDATMFV